MPVFLKAMAKLRTGFGRRKPLVAYVIGPFSLAARVMEETNAAALAKSDPDLMDALVDYAVRVQEAYAKALVAAGADVIVIADPSSEFLSTLFPKDKPSEPSSLRRFCVGPVNRLAGTINAAGAAVIIHTCKRETKPGLMFPFWQAMNVQGYSLAENISMAEAYDKLALDPDGRPNGKIVMGNLSAKELESLGEDPSNQAAAKVTALTDSMGKRPFIISSGCDMSPLTHVNVMRGLRTGAPAARGPGDNGAAPTYMGAGLGVLFAFLWHRLQHLWTRTTSSPSADLLNVYEFREMLHDLGNELASIKGNLSLLAMQLEKRESADDEFITQAREMGDRIASIDVGNRAWAGRVDAEMATENSFSKLYRHPTVTRTLRRDADELRTRVRNQLLEIERICLGNASSIASARQGLSYDLGNSLLSGLRRAQLVIAGSPMIIRDADLEQWTRQVMSNQGKVQVVSRSPLPRATFDEAALYRALSNLIKNARKAHASHIVIELEASPPDSGIMIRVMDDGQGIEREKLDRINALFSVDSPEAMPLRVDAEGDRHGLGLWIVRQAADRLGATVGVDSLSAEEYDSIKLPQGGHFPSEDIPIVPETRQVLDLIIATYETSRNVLNELHNALQANDLATARSIIRQFREKVPALSPAIARMAMPFGSSPSLAPVISSLGHASTHLNANTLMSSDLWQMMWKGGEPPKEVLSHLSEHIDMHRRILAMYTRLREHRRTAIGTTFTIQLPHTPPGLNHDETSEPGSKPRPHNPALRDRHGEPPVYRGSVFGALSAALWGLVWERFVQRRSSRSNLGWNRAEHEQFANYLGYSIQAVMFLCLLIIFVPGQVLVGLAAIYLSLFAMILPEIPSWDIDQAKSLEVRLFPGGSSFWWKDAGPERLTAQAVLDFFEEGVRPGIPLRVVWMTPVRIAFEILQYRKGRRSFRAKLAAIGLGAMWWTWHLFTPCVAYRQAVLDLIQRAMTPPAPTGTPPPSFQDHQPRPGGNSRTTALLCAAA